MSHPQSQRVHEVFEEASARPREERESFINEVCGDDAELRAEVVSLLEHDERAPADFLCPAERDPKTRPTALLEGPDPLIGQRIGQYEIKGVIASGGMGTVYEAEQQKPHRTVALKVMKAWAATRATLRRFEFESEILARLTHPHIAQVYEAGTHQPDRSRDRKGAFATTAVPYFAMEYVPNARTITAYAAQEELSTRARLELFAQVCDAVHYGHRKGVIHRDLKPGNILVDETGQVKIIDFGVARATDLDVAVSTLRTDVGQLIGTVQYMSPEQCAVDPLGLDTRSDVYALGVVFYELLCGQLPYDLQNSAIQVAARVICEREPMRPSAVNRKLRGDLEVIVLKALEKDREKRYQSAGDLAQDVRCYLRGEPIAARPPTLWTRATRWITRHPYFTTVASCLALGAMIVATAIVSRQSIAAHLQKPGPVELTRDEREARLFSVGGELLHTWTAAPDGYIRVAKVVENPQEPGGERFLLIGGRWLEDMDHPHSLNAFDVTGAEPALLWERHVNDAELPDTLRVEREFSGCEFSVAHCIVSDVFPESRGPEIVTAHQHKLTTHTALRVYDLAGQTLYQVWLDVQVEGLYWMSEARLLVIAGRNGTAWWECRGHPESIGHPWVVFAIRPERGLIRKEYIGEHVGPERLDPRWYRCLRPASIRARAEVRCLRVPSAKYDPRRFVNFALTIGQKDASGAWVFKGAMLGWVLNESGEVVTPTPILSDQYRLYQDELPDPTTIYLGDLPPIVEGCP